MAQVRNKFSKEIHTVYGTKETVNGVTMVLLHLDGPFLEGWKWIAIDEFEPVD